ncbi:unnamed protein product [Ceratitis capitata]|uniref:(Mediterranean fruit fly) hypothetical protein n=1 Tax=Ceratitis capitata TaxID=7213 RepID=W8C7E8_CERCA|nr:unnamed protein product [Ceratitis capitata]
MLLTHVYEGKNVKLYTTTTATKPQLNAQKCLQQQQKTSCLQLAIINRQRGAHIAANATLYPLHIYTIIWLCVCVCIFTAATFHKLPATTRTNTIRQQQLYLTLLCATELGRH